MFTKIFVTSHSKSQGLSGALRVGLAGLLLATASVGVAAGSASAQNFNPADNLQTGPNISARQICIIDGHWVVWHPPMVWNSNCIDFHYL